MSATQVREIVIVALVMAIILVAVMLITRYARAETPDQWFNLAVAIQNQRHQLDADEQRFIADVVNRLAVSEDVVPTPAHQKWLRHLSARLKLR